LSARVGICMGILPLCPGALSRQVACEDGWAIVRSLRRPTTASPAGPGAVVVAVINHAPRSLGCGYGTPMLGTALGELTLLDWKQRIFALYAEIRADPSPQAAWERWRAARDELFATHPQSPLPPDQRETFAGLAYHAYDPAFRVTGSVRAADEVVIDIGTSTGDRYQFRRFATASFALAGTGHELPLYWLCGYGGGLFLPVADPTNATTTYGAGRYLLDTVKGADLGLVDGRLVLDFNFAYSPSCAYDPAWTCPLAPADNRLPVAVAAGELRPPSTGIGSKNPLIA
jgi:uncharacterized protein